MCITYTHVNIVKVNNMYVEKVSIYVKNNVI